MTRLESHERTIEKIKQLFAIELAEMPRFEAVYLQVTSIDLIRTDCELKLPECFTQHPMLDVATASFVF